jgi:hypothetical protein
MIMDEFKRRNEAIKATEEKLKQYEARTDINAKFARSNPDIIQKIK